ncbi:MAG: 30S ribosomal protein S12 methylthiotransferase RimO [Firmicutes bacterium]|nr:30S ribosomal protein S12 methylthiotransferase RimO [Bacillota bacterium]
MNKNVGIVSLGCPKNLVDSEVMLGLLKEKGYGIVGKQEEADIIIVNTCGFIDEAKQESINTILDLVSMKNLRCELIIVAGCLAERYNVRIIEEIPEVDGIIGTGYYDKICEVIEKAYKGDKPVLYSQPGFCKYIGKKRVISTPKGYAFLKIADGCDNCCTYCVIPSLRGKYRSRNFEDILDEANYLVQCGAREIILVAQDTTGYGKDIYNERKLADLLKELGKIDSLEWIRILYCYPDEIDDRLIEEIAENPKVCKYLDIPIQHASDKILKRMGRRGSIADIKCLINKIRSRIPGIVIRTSLIVGFPGEDEEDFNVLLSSVKELRFEKLGVFIYSKEEGTPAAKLKGAVKKAIKKKRYENIMSLQKEIVNEINKGRLNKIYTVLVEGVADDGIFYYGRSYSEAPNIDGLIYFTSTYPLEMGSFVNIRILNTEDYDLIGVVENEFTQ